MIRVKRGEMYTSKYAIIVFGSMHVHVYTHMQSNTVIDTTSIKPNICYHIHQLPYTLIYMYISIV